jgi:hypothetical protein
VAAFFDLCDSTVFIACETTAALCAGNKIKMRQNIYAFPIAHTWRPELEARTPQDNTEPFVYLAQQQQQQ